MNDALDVGDMDGAVGKDALRRKRKVLVRIGERIGFVENLPGFVCSMQPPAPTSKSQPPAPKEPRA